MIKTNIHYSDIKIKAEIDDIKRTKTSNISGIKKELLARGYEKLTKKEILAIDRGVTREAIDIYSLKSKFGY